MHIFIPFYHFTDSICKYFHDWVLYLMWLGFNYILLLAGEAGLLSRLAESSWTWACQEADDWFRWCCQFWGGNLTSCYSNMWFPNNTIFFSFIKNGVLDNIMCHIFFIVKLPILQIDGDLHTTIKFIDSLKIPYIAASFGGCESIVDQPAILSYWYSFGFHVQFVMLMILTLHREWSSTWMWPCGESIFSWSFWFVIVSKFTLFLLI